MNKNERWYLIESGESSDMTITAHPSYDAANQVMKNAYQNYAFDPKDYGNDGDCYITSHSAYVDSPVDGWQRHWLIVSDSDLADLAIKA